MIKLELELKKKEAKIKELQNLSSKLTTEKNEAKSNAESDLRELQDKFDECSANFKKVTQLLNKT